jgi:hypothetical protein
VWDTFFSAWLNACFFSSSSRSDKPSSRGSLVGAAAWLQPSVQQLADKLLQRPLVSTTPALVLRAMMCGVLTGTGGPIPHPRLAAAAGLPPDPALAAQVAAAVQQVGAEEELWSVCMVYLLGFVVRMQQDVQGGIGLSVCAASCLCTHHVASLDRHFCWQSSCVRCSLCRKSMVLTTCTARPDPLLLGHQAKDVNRERCLTIACCRQREEGGSMQWLA